MPSCRDVQALNTDTINPLIALILAYYGLPRDRTSPLDRSDLAVNPKKEEEKKKAQLRIYYVCQP